MPNAYIDSLVEKTDLSKTKLEELWDMAKDITKKKFTESDGDRYWAYVTGIFNKAISPHMESEAFAQLVKPIHYDEGIKLPFPNVSDLEEQLNTDPFNQKLSVEGDYEEGKRHEDNMANDININKRAEKGYAFPPKDDSQENVAYRHPTPKEQTADRKAEVHTKDASRDQKRPSLESLTSGKFRIAF